MEGDTPRTLIRGLLQSSRGARSSPRHRQTPYSSNTTTSDEGRVSKMKEKHLNSSMSTSSHQPISSEKVSSSVKRPAKRLLTSSAKRQRSLASTPSETITPRTNIRAFLATADTKTPEKSLETITSNLNERVTRSAVSNRQVQKLIASESRSRRTSSRKSLNQSFPAPRESITPREAIKMYLKTVETKPQARRSTPNKRNVLVNQGEISEEKHDDSETATDEQSQDDEKVESGDEKVESGDEKVESEDNKGESGDEKVESVDEKVKSGDDKGESGDEKVESGDEKVEFGDDKGESGDEKVESGDEKVESHKEDAQIDRLEHGAEFEDNAPIEAHDNYESSQEATAESSQDEQELASQEDTSSQDEQIEPTVNQSRLQDSLQEGESSHEALSGFIDTSNHARTPRRSEWGKLQTPVLPDITTVKATPIVIGKPPIPAQQKKPSNVRKASGKKNQPKKKASSVQRLPTSLVNGIFRHFSALRVSKDALDAVQVGSDAFFEHVATDLTSYCQHTRRRTIEESDVELLMRRQGLVKSRESFHALIEKYLPMEYRQEIIPTAKSGNKVVPKLKNI